MSQHIVRARSQPESRLSGRYIQFFWMVLLAVSGVGCGQVITISPTPTPEPTATIAVEVVLATPLPTATPAPYTPEPTATPTITPTPVIHVIEPGESLLAIAGQYNVTVSALQEANGILDPRVLQIGQELFIPSEEEEATQDTSLTPTPTPIAFAIENVRFHKTGIGGLLVMGEVHNDSGGALEQLRVGVALLDENETELTQANALVALDLVDVDERSPFAILFADAPEHFERYRLHPISGVPAYVGSYYRDLEIRDLTGEGERYESYTVSGRIYNAGPEEAVSVQVILTAYDPLGRVIAMRKIVPEHNVVPRGGETNFSAVLALIGGPVEHVSAVAQGRRISSQNSE
ncbi:MAG: LysM peptidoglycan-binding domain-containing protein [Chloroflexota bacterium]